MEQLKPGANFSSRRKPSSWHKTCTLHKNASSVTSAKTCLYLVVSCPRCHSLKKERRRRKILILWPKTRCAWSWNILWHGRKGLSNKRSVGWAGKKGSRKHTRHVSFVKITESTFMFVSMKNGCWLVVTLSPVTCLKLFLAKTRRNNEIYSMQKQMVLKEGGNTLTSRLCLLNVAIFFMCPWSHKFKSRRLGGLCLHMPTRQLSVGKNVFFCLKMAKNDCSGKHLFYFLLYNTGLHKWIKLCNLLHATLHKHEIQFLNLHYVSVWM